MLKLLDLLDQAIGNNVKTVGFIRSNNQYCLSLTARMLALA